jgi:hypothetical protein
MYNSTTPMIHHPLRESKNGSHVTQFINDPSASQRIQRMGPINKSSLKSKGLGLKRRKERHFSQGSDEGQAL